MTTCFFIFNLHYGHPVCSPPLSTWNVTLAQPVLEEQDCWWARQAQTFKLSQRVLSTGDSRVALVVKNLPANAEETWVQFLSQEDPLQKDMATHSSILIWRIPWTEEAGGLQSVGSQRDTTEHTQICCQLPNGSGALKGVLIKSRFWFGSIYAIFLFLHFQSFCFNII